MEGVAAILTRYADQHFDFADAVLMHLAERESIKTIFTTDQRHFGVYRTLTGTALEIRPVAM
jgi:uncharacterized protein